MNEEDRKRVQAIKKESIHDNARYIQGRVSVIVAVYNAERYLAKCIDSICRQTYRDLEIILVDDGSTDGSGAMCDQVAREDKRVIVIHQDNAGTSQARNVGLDAATGEYLTFVDADDYINDDYIETMRRSAEEHQADMLMCLTRRFCLDEYGNERILNDVFHVRQAEYTYDVKEALKCILYQREIDEAVTGKIYKSSLFCGIRFPVGRRFEDIGTTYKLIMRSSKITAIAYKGYGYLQREDSFIHSFSRTKTIDGIEMAEQERDQIIDRYPELEKAARCRCVSMYFSGALAAGNEKDLCDQLWRKIKRERLKVILDPEARKKTRAALLLSYFGRKPLRWIYYRKKEQVA